jgi:hypothetical protein
MPQQSFKTLKPIHPGAPGMRSTGQVADDGVDTEPADQEVGHRVILASLD